ncbi:hypothetical protein VMCG_05737 [Cytospora schulzeri]|uniref:ABC transporter domain-containing protein n=1 Tax=Cytospora schulzeri TaxID=448051 RepID=A0A423WHY7_9PEZI|nr:hypothetical protein VMCG_05737 [Valsa malicola]
MEFPPVCGDVSFGPSVKSADCRGGFDFTEKGTIIVYTALQLAILVLTTTNDDIRTNVSIASTTLSVLSALTLAVLSHFEHVKSARPSFLINLYLIATLLFDAARVRTQWLIGTNDVVAGVLTASLAVKGVVLLLEAVEKRSLLLGLDRHFSQESTSGLFNRSSFWWLNSFLLTGFKNVLTLEELPAIYEKLDSTRLAAQLQFAWDKCKKTRKHALACACVWSLRWEVIAIYVPKLCYAALSISQVYLIQDAVRYVQGTESTSTGYGLIGAFAFVYIGLAIMMGWSSHLSYRLMTMMRGQLISIIYTKMLTLPIGDVNESAAMSLMGTDVQTIAESFWYLIVEVIPSVIQVAIAVYLLYVQLGAVCVAPVLVTIISTSLSVVIAGFITSRQRAWLEAVQRRINYTSGILGSMRNVKMLGLTAQLSSNIHQLRSSELATSKRYRKVQSLNVSLVNLPGTFNGFFVFTAYAIVAHVQGGSGLSVSQAVTSLAALNLLAAPLGMLLSAIPQGWASLGCFERIQKFLLETSRTERRTLHSTTTSTVSASGQEGIELDSIPMPLANKIIVSGGNFGWSDSSSNIVKEVDMSIQLGSELTIVVGPVGCGKSTLLKGLLGETPRLEGHVEVSSPEIAYCDQTPWIINGSIRDNITARSGFDAGWYATVCQACGLDIDLRQMPDGDSTVVGSKGVKLSGGQKQRISIARAVYSRKKLAIFDDSLSGLDSVTEELVFKRVFGRNGLLRKIGATIILATHSGTDSHVKRLPQADMILALDQNGKVVEQGKFTELNVPGNYIHTLQVKLQKEEATHDDEVVDDSHYNPQTHVPSSKAVIDNSRKSGDWAIYKYYARALGPWGIAMFVGLVAGNETFTGMGSYWLGMFAFLDFMEGLFMVGAIALEANAPLYSQFIESLAGLITIRSFGWTGAYTAENRRLLDGSQKPYYLLLCIQRWLVLVLDLVVAGLALVLIGMAVALRSHMNPGFLGLALVNMMNLSHSLTNLVQYWTNLETTLGAIARIKDFSENTPAEWSPDGDLDLDDNWPSRGNLRFEHVSASYGQATTRVLEDISFSIEGGQKIGIVGRTGSGKSSSTLAILRLINVIPGRIVLDDIDLATVPGSLVRERLTCLTQDPFLFPASVRTNLDPMSKSSDEAIITALQRVGLWDVLKDKSADKTSGSSGVLATQVDTDFLSHGQRQLFCLARAMLKPGKVLILDEPTSRQVASLEGRLALKYTDSKTTQRGY